MLWVSLLCNYQMLPKFHWNLAKCSTDCIDRILKGMPLTITTTTRYNHIFTLDFAEMIIKASLYTPNRSCQKIITTTGTMQLYNWHCINLISNGNLWSRHETSSKLWHRLVQSGTTKTESLTIAVFNCVNVVAVASVDSTTNVQTSRSLTSNHLGGVNRSKRLALLVKNWNRSSQR